MGNAVKKSNLDKAVTSKLNALAKAEVELSEVNQEELDQAAQARFDKKQANTDYYNGLHTDGLLASALVVDSANRASKAAQNAEQRQNDVKLEMPCIIKGKYFKKLVKEGCLMESIEWDGANLIVLVQTDNKGRKENECVLLASVLEVADDELVHDWLTLKDEVAA